MFFYDVIKSIMVLQAVGLIIQGSCHHGCVHDKLEATKGISAQYYDFTKTVGNTAPSKSKHVRADSSSKKSAELTVPNKAVHRTKRSNEDATDDNHNKHPVTSSSRSQKQFASAPRQVKKSIGGTQANFRSQASDEAGTPTQDPNAKQCVKELFKPIRIKIFMQEEYITFHMTSDFFRRLNESVHRAVKKIQNILSVIPVKGRLRFNRTPESICSNFWSEPFPTRLKPRRCAIPDASYSGETCMKDFKLPDAHLRGYPIYRNNTTTPTSWLYRDGVGIAEADMVLYVHARNTILCKENGLIAYATYCQVDQRHRPIAGLINYCPSYLKDHLYNKNVMYTTSLHEIFHILGFSKDLFDKFQTCKISIGKSQGNNRTLIKWVCEKRKNTVSFIDGVKNIVTPAVRRETKRHFGCDTVEGCPLENHIVRPVTTSSHWEGRLMQGSLMAPTISRPHLTVIDRVTLSAFEDMGWYQVNYNQSEEFLWGNQAGCEFLSNDACTNDSEYFCHDKSSVGCHYLHMDKGICKSGKYLDGCRVFKTSVGMECWKPENGKEAQQMYGEIYSTESRCFQSNLQQTNTTDSESSVATVQGRCYEHRCGGNNTFEVRVQGSEWKTCHDNEYIVFEGYEGGIVCPAASIICRNTTRGKVKDPEYEQANMIVCGNFTMTIPGLSDGVESVVTSAGLNNVTGALEAKLGEMIIESTNVCKNCVTDVQHKNDDRVNFILKMQLASTNISSSAKAESGSGEINNNKDSKNISMDGLCVNAVRDLLNSSDKKNMRLTFDGVDYIPDKINFDSPIEEVTKLKKSHVLDVDSGTSGTGVYVAAAVGSVCGSVLIMVGVVVYLKNAINVAVSPIPATPMRADVRYHFNSGSFTVAPSENGSAGQLPNVDIP